MKIESKPVTTTQVIIELNDEDVIQINVARSALTDIINMVKLIDDDHDINSLKFARQLLTQLVGITTR